MGVVMLSRLADSLYWMSRYVERAENVARFIDVNTWLSLDLPAGYQEQWSPLISTTGDDALFAKHYPDASKRNVIRFLTFDTRNPNSIFSAITAARENARLARQYITLETWEQINRFYLAIQNGARLASRGFEPGQDFFSDVMNASHLFLGTLYATMSHNEGWHFCRLGRLIERADKTSRILDTKYYLLLPSIDSIGTPYDDIMWAAVLRSTSALEMYRKRFQQISPDRIVEFLVLDREFPRAIHYCVVSAEGSLHAISGAPIRTFSNPAEQHLGRLCAELNYIQVGEIINRGLHEFLDDIQVRLNMVGDAIENAFFALQPVPVLPQYQAGSDA
ncbi:MAG TPA: alpha-E domain-containing protein [Terriglobia bacterium]|nr:alpha-E domain-containing protein [Terriglobia bacterium]